jgi:hypothetical protein
VCVVVCGCDWVCVGVCVGMCVGVCMCVWVCVGVCMCVWVCVGVGVCVCVNSVLRRIFRHGKEQSTEMFRPVHLEECHRFYVSL